MTYTIDTVAKSLFETTGVLLSCYDEKETELQTLVSTELNLSLLLKHSELGQMIQRKKLLDMQPKFVFNEINCGWMALYIAEKRQVYIVGPVLFSAISDEHILNYFYRKAGLLQEAKVLATEYHRVPIVSFASLMQVFSFIYHLLTGETIDVSTFEMNINNIEEVVINRNEEEVYKIQQRNFAVALESEAYLLDCVRKGDVERLRMQNVEAVQELTFLGNNELRSMKNNFITAIASITRAAMEGGLAVEIAYPLSDIYIVQLENKEDISETIDVYQQAVLDFAMRVKNNQFKIQYSKMINKCCGYIGANYDLPLKLSDVAKVVDLHPDHLSRRFKHETGKSVNQYIRETKVAEAKLLICHTQLDLTEIAFQLGYSNQGKFINDFKKETEMLPSDYRRNKK